MLRLQEHDIGSRKEQENPVLLCKPKIRVNKYMRMKVGKSITGAEESVVVEKFL